MFDNRRVSFERIAKSSDLTSDVVTDAVRSPAELKRLLQRIAEIAQPEQGWARIFKVIAKVAMVEWLEGELQVDFAGDVTSTTLSFYSVLGIGIRERLVPPVTLSVPIDEFQRAVVLQPDSIAPLRARQGLNRLTLSLGTSVRDKDIPEFELEAQALGDGERITAPPPPLVLAEEDIAPEVYTRSTKPPPPQS